MDEDEDRRRSPFGEVDIKPFDIGRSIDRPFAFGAVPSLDPQPVFFMPVLDRQFGIAVEAVVIGADLRFDPARFVASSKCTLEGALGSSVSIAEANG